MLEHEKGARRQELPCGGGPGMRKGRAAVPRGPKEPRACGACRAVCPGITPAPNPRYPAMPVRAFHEITVLTSNWAMVMGPTPPGTGVMAEAMQLMSSYLQSPTSPSSVR